VPDPRVLDVLLRRWGCASLYYPLPRRHRHQQQQQQLCDADSDDLSSVMRLRELTLSVALAFVRAARSNTLQCLRTLHLTSLYTGQTLRPRLRDTSGCQTG